ncbi:uncharacterized protein KGF55_005781 [Candida pseudojiufengensis]|uniref:uncharacterized protein n=1 Tax=Candida pseudojiufengensis TaxID=497109 RepID=UPI0022253B76|nr:uncharacterized protein KGF55_005781 [Candida pseudojiufengensis]KAI5958521.1 hypothetical protein KGF55_005781 [Candida pseudojiufengensis]
MDLEDIDSTSSDDDDIFGFSTPKVKKYTRDNASNSQSNGSNISPASRKPIKSTSSLPKTTNKVYTVTKSNSQISNKPRLKRENRSKLSDDIFDIDVPTIFKTDGNKLSKINKEHQKIKEIFENQNKIEQSIKTHHEKLKLQLLNELNEEEFIDENDNSIGYNGSHKNSVKKFDIVRDNSYLEKLISKDKSNIDGFGISRHFFCLKNVEVDENTKSDLNPTNLSIKRSLKFLISNNPELAVENILKSFPDPKSFIIKSLFSTNLQYLNSIIEYYNSIDEDSSLFIGNEDFDNLISTFGLDSKIISLSSFRILSSDSLNLPIKISEINNNLNVQLSRFTIIFHAILNNQREKFDFRNLITIFICILNDYNVNKNELRSLHQFITSIFPIFVRKLDENVLLDLLFDTIVNIKTNFGSNDSVERVKKIDYELQYNIIKLLNITFLTDNSNQINLRLQNLNKLSNIIVELNLRFILSENYNNKLTTKHSKANIIYQIANNLVIPDDITNSLHLNDLNSANLVYLYYYKIKVLMFLLINPFNLNSTKAQNIKSLKSLKVSIEKIQHNCYELIRKLGGIKIDLVIENMNKSNDNGATKFQYSFDREEMVNFLTDIHQDLSFQIDKLDYDLKLVSNDFFYSV